MRWLCFWKSARYKKAQQVFNAMAGKVMEPMESDHKMITINWTTSMLLLITIIVTLYFNSDRSDKRWSAVAMEAFKAGLCYVPDSPGVAQHHWEKCK